MDRPVQTAVRFLLGGEHRSIDDLPPTTTILDYLRIRERLTGTKEGCAEGDCGACTVLLAEPDGEGGLRAWPVNSCIQFLPGLHGRQLLTVEHLARPGGELHPVQRSLVDHHGSQCGFCTPGFVMQIYAAWRRGGDWDRSALNDWLAGNLCRCTGYGPILDAAEAALSSHDGGSQDGEGQTVGALAAMEENGPFWFAAEGQTWVTPQTVDQLAEIYADHPDATLVGGATDVGLWVTKQQRHLPFLIDVTRIPALKEIRESDLAFHIGAAVSLEEAAVHLATIHPDLGELMRRFASVQIRSAGTIGGNIANGSPIGDIPPALIALGARLVLRKGDATREIRLQDFFIDYGRQDRQPGEFVASVIVPKLADHAKFAAYKIAKRFDQDISAVMAALMLEVEDGRVTTVRLAFGGMAATPRRATQAENVLRQEGWSREAVEAAADALEEDFEPITDMRASAQYRHAVARNLLLRFWIEQTENPGATRVWTAA